MPLYEYECDACGARSELIRKFSDPPVVVCPKCGAEGLRKLISSAAVQFKGSGWYVTDYAKKSGSTAAPAGTSEAKTETKPDAVKDTGDGKPATPAPATPGKDK